MNRRQKKIIANFVTVIFLTTLGVVAMIHLKDWVNRSEAHRAISQLGQSVTRYRQKYKAVPPESYVKELKDNLEGKARIGDFHYRARWIEFGAGTDEILGYVVQNYHTGIFSKNVLVLRLDGTVEWMDEKPFKNQLDQQQTPQEKAENSLREEFDF